MDTLASRAERLVQVFEDAGFSIVEVDLGTDYGEREFEVTLTLYDHEEK